MNIYVLNKSTVLEDTEIQSWLPAFNLFLGNVKRWWPRPSNLIWSDKAKEPELAWKLIFADTSDEADALGYHDFTSNGRPISYVFAKDLAKQGYSATVTATHEIAEMVADPWISQMFQVSDNQFYAQEIGDPVEADEFGYTIKVPGFPDVLCSDFVTPSWFIPGSKGYILDQCKHVERPLQLLSGGYMSVFTSGQGWTEIYAKQAGKGRRVSAKKQGDPKGKGRYSRLTKYGRERGKLS